MGMKNARTILILGVWVAILPYLGFPYSWKQTLFTLSGLIFMYMAYLLYKKEKMERKEVKKAVSFDNFSENKDFNEKSN
jgi:hypothetical protein